MAATLKRERSHAVHAVPADAMRTAFNNASAFKPEDCLILTEVLQLPFT